MTRLATIETGILVTLVLKQKPQKHSSVVDSDKLQQDGHLIADQLETAVNDKEDDYDLLDDKSPSASFDFPQKIQTAYSFSS